MSRIICNWRGISGTTFVKDYENFEFHKDDIMWICDTIDYSNLQAIYDKTPPKYVVGDNASSIEYPVKIFTSVYRGLELEFLRMQHKIQIDNFNGTKSCFNFLINKKQINRHLLIKLVEYFNLDKFNYTWSGIGRDFNMSDICNEWNLVDSESKQFSNEMRSSMLSPIVLDKFFVNFKEDNSKLQESYIAGYGSNDWTWNNIFRQLMPSTAVALISESVRFEKSSVFTEKTLYSIFALNFPIWIGGYGHADQFKQMGFDNFDDIIDHTYQYKETLFERCYYAFFNNLKLLSDLEYVSEIRKKNLHRLENNKKLLFDHQITKSVNQKIATWPTDLSQAMLPIFERYRKGFGS